MACQPHPLPHPVRADGWTAISQYLDSVVADGAAPGAVLAVSLGGRHYFHGSGHLGIDDATRPDSSTVYDLASLTKVVGLTTLVMLAVEEGKLELDAPIARYVPAFGGRDADPPSRRAVTIRHLLTHSSGLPAWRPLHLGTTSRTEAFAAVDSATLDTLPGARFVYSDLGAILVTQAVETIYGTRLDSLVAERVAAPLELRETRYLPPESWRARIAPTENDPWRGRVLRGEVHDENAERLDGVSGHAGLFSSGRDLLRFADWLLWSTGDCITPDSGGPAITPRTVRQFTVPQYLPPGSSRALGWDTPSEASSAGRRLSPRSFGHTGFTGTSIWVDPSRCLAIVLLSNRVHPSRGNNRWGPLRGEVADRVVSRLVDSTVTP